MIKGAVLLDSAGLDIPLQINELGGARNELNYQTAFGYDPAFWAQMSPTLRMSASVPVAPIVLFHADGRTSSEVQAQRFADVAKAAGKQAYVHAAAGKTHETINRDVGLSGDQVSKTSWRYLSQWL